MVKNKSKTGKRKGMSLMEFVRTKKCDDFMEAFHDMDDKKKALFAYGTEVARVPWDDMCQRFGLPKIAFEFGEKILKFDAMYMTLVNAVMDAAKGGDDDKALEILASKAREIKIESIKKAAYRVVLGQLEGDDEYWRNEGVKNAQRIGAFDSEEENRKRADMDILQTIGSIKLSVGN